MRWRFGLALPVISVLLAGCQDSSLDLAAAPARKVVVGPTVPVAVESLEGVPAAMSPRFSAALATEAQAREIVFVDATGAPRYKLRGYLNAYAADGGNRLAWVWDVFDAKRQRARRAEGEEALKGSGGDPWASVDEATLRRVAARSLDEVGGYLADRAGDVPMANAPAPTRTAAR